MNTSLKKNWYKNWYFGILMIPVSILKLVQYTSFNKKTGMKKLVFLKYQFFQTSFIFKTSFKKLVYYQNWLKTKFFTGFYRIERFEARQGKKYL